MKRIFNWLFILPALISFQMMGQETVLSKEEAVKAALDYNYGIKISSNRVEIAENNQSIWNSGYLPSLTGLAGASYDINDRNTEIQGEETIDQNNVENELYRGSLNVDYLLFDGLGRYYNFKSLKEEYHLSRLEARETVENTILQLMSVYFEIARLYENIDVLAESMQISRDRVVRAKYQYEYGQVNNLAVLNARVDVNNDSINLLQARQQLNNTKRDLNVLLDREMENLSYMVDTTVTFLPMLQIENLIAQASENNVRILQSESSITISEYDIKVSKSGYLPSVGLTGSYGWNQNIGGPTAFFPGSTTSTTGLSAGVNLTWNIFDGGRTRIQTQNSKINNETQRLLKEQVELEVRRDIANALGTYENKLYIFHVQEENVITNLDNFNRTQEQYKLGQVSSIEFRQAQINLLNARTSLNLAKYDAKLAELEVLRLTGQLLNVEY
ncbi:Outer membrane protein TolC [Salinimicrobium catena]|uniref:Outer membrane protein TolC n=1 Tax=Salinimicrobium catena TaxID=390640 RepID=A0A1H5GY87_9FLAO|nr:TolC family protein [Salinimicrobium catena]SDK66506.1 Outer membrane protein TolC [Salinimicrobium catena]SEE20657.1 Outer membrane protein TolC [Salinimicrobium catena]